MFSANKNSTETRRKMAELGLEYRKNKEFKDVLAAFCKAKNHKYGFGITELEIKAFATFLELDVVKKKRKRKDGSV